MNFGFILSVSLHVIIGLMLTLDLYSKQKKIDPQQPMIFELIAVRDIDNIKTTQKKTKLDEINQKKTEKFYKEKHVEQKLAFKSKKNDKTVVKAIPVSAKTSSASETKKEEQKKKLSPKKVEEKVEKKIEIEKKPTVVEEKKQEMKKLVKEESKKQEKSDSKSLKPEEKKPKSEVDIFAKTVMQTLEASTAYEKKEQKSASETLGEAKKKIDEDKILSVSEASYIRAKISQNWNTTYFTNAQELDMFVDILLKLDGNGVIKEVSVKSSKGSGLQHYQLFIDSALTAVRKASPLDQLSSDNYEIWKEMIISFTPKGLVY